MLPTQHVHFALAAPGAPSPTAGAAGVIARRGERAAKRRRELDARASELVAERPAARRARRASRPISDARRPDGSGAAALPIDDGTTATAAATATAQRARGDGVATCDHGPCTLRPSPRRGTTDPTLATILRSFDLRPEEWPSLRTLTDAMAMAPGCVGDSTEAVRHACVLEMLNAPPAAHQAPPPTATHAAARQRAAPLPRPPPRSPEQAVARARPPAAFRSRTATEKAERDAKAAELEAALPSEWWGALSFAAANGARSGTSMPPHVKRGIVRGVWKRKGKGVLVNALRAFRELRSFCRLNGQPVGPPISGDTVVWFLSEYRAGATDRATTRRAARARKRKAPRRNDRGGATAAAPLRLGLCTLERSGFPIEADTPMAAAVCSCGPGMPAVRPMASLETLRTCERISHDSRRSDQERAYAGATFVAIAASLRVIDGLRTESIRLETANVRDRRVTFACGIAALSKGAELEQMRPLPWRAPIVAMTELGGPDLVPLFASFPDEGGSLFRAFDTGASAARHDVTRAAAWKNEAETFDGVVAAQRAMLGTAQGLSPSERAAIGGHEYRHVLPEVARVLGLPTQYRESLGYWRESKAVVSDSASDASAYARALRAARLPGSRASRLSRLCNRYSSVDAEPIESDEARVACLDAVSRLLASQDPLPRGTREQLRLIAATVAP